MIIKKKVKKVAKGYRLRPETHLLIKEIQNILQTDQDAVITKACKMFYKEIQRKQKIKGRTKSKLTAKPLTGDVDEQ